MTGVEIDVKSVTHSLANYRAANLDFVCGDAHTLPLGDANVDVVISFQTLEHLADQDRFLREVKRVLRPNSLLVNSTPERAVYSAPGDPNPYHILELTDPEFRSLLRTRFARIDVLAQRPVLGSLLASQTTVGCEATNDGMRTSSKRPPGLTRAHYLVAIATANDALHVASVAQSTTFDSEDSHVSTHPPPGWGDRSSAVDGFTR